MDSIVLNISILEKFEDANNVQLCSDLLKNFKLPGSV